MAYADWIHTSEKLTDREAGQLFKHLLRYVNDQDPEPPNRLIDLTFEPWKQQLKRDLKKYETKVNTARANGQKGGRPPKPKETEITQSVNLEPKKPDTDTDTVKDKDKDKDIIENRKAAFYKKLHPLIDEFTKKTVREFYDYWTEHNDKGKKMRYEMAKNQPFNIMRRLKTWKQKEKQYGSSKNFTKGTAQTRADRQDY